MAKSKELVSSGVPAVGSLPWGSHFCQFYKTKQDLVDMLVPFFAEGLRGNERCLWITSQPLQADEATSMLAQSLPDLQRYIDRRQILIRNHGDWYLEQKDDADGGVLGRWMTEEARALSAGYAGLRLTGNASFVESDQWRSFLDYEKAVHAAFRSRRILALCSYPVDRVDSHDVLEVLLHHDFALSRHEGEWELLQSAQKPRA